MAGIEDLLGGSRPEFGRDARPEEGALGLARRDKLEDPGYTYARAVSLVRHGREGLDVVVALGEDGSLGIHFEGEYGDPAGTLAPDSDGRLMTEILHHAPLLVVPPLGCTIWPTSAADPSRARNATVAATSSGRPMCPKGVSEA